MSTWGPGGEEEEGFLKEPRICMRQEQDGSFCGFQGRESIETGGCKLSPPGQALLHIRGITFPLLESI